LDRAEPGGGVFSGEEDKDFAGKKGGGESARL